MKIVINTSILNAPKTGIGQYVVGIIQEFIKNPNLELHFFHGFSWRTSLPNTSLKSYSQISSWIKRMIPNAYQLRRIFFQRVFTNGIKSINPDIYHEPSLWPYSFDGKKIMTIHDLTHIHFPETQPKDRLREINKRIEKAIETSNHIITDSEFIKKDVMKHYSVDEKKITSIHLGVSPLYRQKSEDEWNHSPGNLKYKKYILCVGTLEPRKNLSLALKGYLNLPESLKEEYPMVFIGGKGWNLEGQEDFIQSALNSKYIHLTGYLDDFSVSNLISGAKLVLYTSLYEGFGLPIIESMACGVPIILTKHASLPEIASNAGNFIEDDVKSCSDSIIQLIEDFSLYENKKKLGLERSKSFTWESCASKTLKIYEEVLSKK
jgi:glycosyltransferase involved in cell wall biosynthesis